jgi:outer membrane immunogenic protein
MFIDLGEESENYQDTLCGVACTARVGWNDEFWVGRVGLTYRFGAREEEAAPLK